MLKFNNISIIHIIFIICSAASDANENRFKSQFGFEFEMPKNYEIINNLNLYKIYNLKHLSKNKQDQIKKYADVLKSKNIEILYNFKQSLLNNISILKFKAQYKVSERNVKNQCQKIINFEKKISKKKVNLIECKMYNYPTEAEWSMYRENKSSFFDNETTQQIIFMYKKNEFIITVACIEKCKIIKQDLFNLVKSIKFLN